MNRGGARHPKSRSRAPGPTAVPRRAAGAGVRHHSQHDSPLTPGFQPPNPMGTDKTKPSRHPCHVCARIARLGMQSEGLGRYRNGASGKLLTRRFLRFGWSEGFGSAAWGAGGRELKSHPSRLISPGQTPVLADFGHVQFSICAHGARERVGDSLIAAPAHLTDACEPSTRPVGQWTTRTSRHDPHIDPNAKVAHEPAFGDAPRCICLALRGQLSNARIPQSQWVQGDDVDRNLDVATLSP